MTKIINFYKQFRVLGEDNGANDVVSMSDTLRNDLKDSDNETAIMGGANAMRASLNAGYTNAALLLAHLRDWGRFLSVPDPGDVGSVIAEMRKDFVDNARRVKSRAFTFGTPTFSGPTGTGAIRRLTKDDRGFDIESAYSADTYEARCVRDANTGASRNQEVFLLRTGDAARDQLETLGAGLAIEIACVDPGVDSLLGNASFDSFAGTQTSPTDITDWTVSPGAVSGGAFGFDTTNRFLAPRDENEVRVALRIEANRKLTQRLDLRGTSLDPNVPYYAAIAFNRTVGAASGTLALRVGAVSASVVFSAQSGYTILETPSTLGTSNWYRSSVEETMNVEVEVTGLSGTLLVDDLWLVAMTPFNGSWYVFRPGATPFRAGTIGGSSGDRATWTDTGGEAGINQRHLARLLGAYLPHSSAGGTTIPDA